MHNTALVGDADFPFRSTSADILKDQVVWGKIKNIDLVRVSKKVSLDNNLNTEETNLAINAYRVYLFLAYLAQKEGVKVIPFVSVDKVWHAHILQSLSRYIDEVRDAIGFVLDHISTLPDDNPTVDSTLMADYLKRNYIPMFVHDIDHAQCDGGSMCEFGDGQ